jgi:hypothetical protein
MATFNICPRIAASAEGRYLASTHSLMVLQAYIDDSRSTWPEGVFVLAGCMATDDGWVSFARDWQELLPLAPVNSKGRRNFKFHDFVYAGRDRIENLNAFSRVISCHVSCNIVFSMRVSDLRRAQQRIQAPGIRIEWGDYANPWIFAFISLLEGFHNQRSQFAPLLSDDVDVDFIFDEQSDKSILYKEWEEFLKAQAPGSAVHRFSKSPPRFEDDSKSLPLQAADFVAGWARHCLERGINPATKGIEIQGIEVRNPFVPMIRVNQTEDHMAKFLLDMIRVNLSPGQYACDIRVTYSS